LPDCPALVFQLLNVGELAVLDIALCPHCLAVAQFKLRFERFDIVADRATGLFEMNLEARALARLLVGGSTQVEHDIKYVFST
jgi:hypothetical protein